MRASGLTREIERAYAAADAFVLPTPYDAFGMVITDVKMSSRSEYYSYLDPDDEGSPNGRGRSRSRDRVQTPS